MQIKTIVRYHFTPTKMARLKKKKHTQKISVDEDAEKMEPSYIAGGNVKWYSNCGKQFGDFL